MRQLHWITLVGALAALGHGGCSHDIEGDEPGECSDGADNDRDGLFDCDDPDCAGAPACKGTSTGSGGNGGGGGGSGGGGSTRKWKQVASGGVHNCGIETDGTVRCWGNDADGQSTPPAGAFAEARVSFFHSCARAADATVTCWGCKGSHDYGQCDVPATAIDVVSFDTGSYATCAASSDGDVQCWGCNGADQGQCTPPTGVFSNVTVGSLHACGLSSGAVVCWGNDEYGQSSAPSKAFAQIDAGTWHTCGVGTDKAVRCWGCTSPGPTQPADFGQCDAPAGSFEQVAASVYHSCGLRSDGTIACWGCVGEHDGASTDAGQCTPPKGSFKAVGVGKYHGCALREDDTLVCWGNDSFGQLTVP